MEAGNPEILKQLEADNLLDDTIVFFYSDHGSGMPRSKRWPYDSGLRVPLIPGPRAFCRKRFNLAMHPYEIIEI